MVSERMMNLEKHRYIEKDRILIWLIGLYFFLSFFEPYLSGAIGSVMKYYVILVMLVIGLRKGIRINTYNPSMFLVIWFVYRCVTIIWSRDITIINMYFFGILLMVVFSYFLSELELGNRLIETVINTTFLGSLSIGTLSLFNHTAYLGVANRQVLLLFNTVLDPNNQAAFLAIGIAIALFKLFSNVRIYKKVMYIMAIITNSYSILLTGSRGGLLTIVILIVLYILFFAKSLKIKVLSIATISLIVYAAYRLASLYLPTDIFLRLFTFSTYGEGSGRTEIWNNALNYMRSNPIYYLIGSGWGAYWGLNGYKVMLHNTFLGIFFEMGLVGVFLFFYPIVRATMLLTKKKVYLPVFILIAGFVPCVFLEAINKRFFWNVIFIVLMYYSRETTTSKFPEDIDI